MQVDLTYEEIEQIVMFAGVTIEEMPDEVLPSPPFLALLERLERMMPNEASIEARYPDEEERAQASTRNIISGLNKLVDAFERMGG